LAVAISQSVLIILQGEPWENLDLAREPPFKKVWEPLGYRGIAQFKREYC